MIQIDAENAFDKIQLPFVIKKRKRHTEELPQHNKGHL
jgi:hypothetical protein